MYVAGPIYASNECSNLMQMHARLGEVLFMAASAASDNATYRYYAESVKRFCRSIELCDDYLRGYYGLKQVRASLCIGTLH